MIKKLKIKNYRSIRELEIELGKINAFIGPNNSGKSNIMKAINLILGETYPTVRSFDEKDFYNYDKNNPIEIEVYFDSYLETDNRVNGFQLTFDGQNCEYYCINSEGTHICRVSNDHRNEVLALYLSVERLASQQLRVSQWSLYGKILKHLNEEMDQDLKNRIKELINQATTQLEEYTDHFRSILSEHTKNQVGLDLELNLSLIDPLFLLKNLRPYFIEDEKKSDAEDVGAGVQSALAIAIAKAYTKIVRKSAILIIEEPELYLHPHGCRHFYKLLEELSNEGLQIIYTTHESYFVNIKNYQSIYIVRKEDGETKVYSGRTLDNLNTDEVRLASKFNEYINEVFFANHVILVEGFTDKIACQLALEKLNIDLDLENISIIDCGSKTAIKPLAEIIKHFGIRVYVLIDSDATNEINELKRIIGENFVFIQDPDLEGMLGKDKLGLNENEKLNRQRALKLLPEYFNKNEIPEIYNRLYNLLKRRDLGT